VSLFASACPAGEIRIMRLPSEYGASSLPRLASGIPCGKTDGFSSVVRFSVALSLSSAFSLALPHPFCAQNGERFDFFTL